MYLATAPAITAHDFVGLPQHRVLEQESTFNLPLAQTRSNAQSPADTLAVTLTSGEQSRADALALINRRYAWRGYGSDHKLSSSDEATTFTARFDDRLIGTVTLAADSPQGLAVDKTFSEEMKFFRRKPNAKLCELQKLAMDYGSDAMPILAAMYHFVFIYGKTNFLGTDLLIEVNPRHAAFYERMLHFRKVGALKTNASVDAPSQLMWLPVSDIDAAIDNKGDSRYAKSLFRYFYDRDFHDRMIDQLNDGTMREISATLH